MFILNYFDFSAPFQNIDDFVKIFWESDFKDIMATCPECGGLMVSKMKRKICETCGLSLTEFEYERMWDKIKDEKVDKQTQRKKDQSEYLSWYLSKKKEE